MQLVQMRYKDYIWPHNPADIQVEEKRDIKVINRPYATGVVQDYGELPREISGTGEFYGETAIADYFRLSGVYKKGGAGRLVLPGFDPVWAHFQTLSLIGRPGPGIITYRFLFLEEQSVTGAGTAGPLTHTAAEGDTLFSIGAVYGVSVERLLALNPGLRNPFDIDAGRVVTLR